MKTLQELREERSKHVEAARKLVEEHPGDKWTDEVQAKYDEHLAAVESLDAEIERLQKVLDLAAEQPPTDTSAASIAGQAAAARIEVEHKPVYASLGAQLLDVRAMTLDTAEAPRARERFEKVVNAAGATTAIDSEGGYLVETDKSKEIRDTAVETGVFSSQCSRQPIGPNSDGFEYLAAKDRDRSQKNMAGGIQVFRKGEVDAMQSSGKAVLEPRELRLEDMYGLVYVTNRMLRDAVALTEYIKRKLRQQLAWKLDYEILYGTGAGQCLGVANSDILVEVPAEAGQAADTIVVQNVAKMLARFAGDITNARWYINPDCLPQLITLTLGDQPIYLPGGNVAEAPFGTLFGVPIRPTEFSKSLGDKLDIMLADFSEYLLIEKGGVEEAESIHVRFLTDETAFRFIVRNNGMPEHESPIIPLHGSNTLSPFVTLAERA